MDRDTELDLLARVRAGDASAFDTIYADFNGRLLNFLARLTGRRDLAEELLEETWLRFVRHHHALPPGSRIGAWLFTVARNLYVSYARTRVTESRVVASLSLWPESVSETPFETTARNEFEARLEAALAELPATLREALLLTAIEGMTPLEAARICGITGEAMRQRLRRARTALADRLEDFGESSRLRTGA